MSIEDEKADTFIQERLDALYEVDCKVVSLLDLMSTLFATFSTPKQQDNREMKETFSTQTEKIYGILSKVAIDLRKEVKIMDDNIGVYDKNKDGVMILPIAVDQKNTTLGREKMKKQLEELNVLLKSDKIKVKPEESQDVEMKSPEKETTGEEEEIPKEKEETPKEEKETPKDTKADPVKVEDPTKEEEEDNDDDLFEEIM